MKKKFYCIITGIIMFFSFCTITIATSLNGDELLKIKGYTIRKDTTINEINQTLGEHKLITSTAFGGKAYSYYDENYSYYVFIETNTNGTIKSYGVIGKDFETIRVAQKDQVGNTYRYMSGVIVDIDDYVEGAHEYVATLNEVKEYWQRYESDYGYLYDLQKHAVEAARAIAVVNEDAGRFTQTYLPEDIFYKIQQLQDNNTNIYDYAKNTGKLKPLELIGASYGRDFFENLPSPIDFASYVSRHYSTNSHPYILFDLDITGNVPNFYQTKQYSIYNFFVDPSFLEEKAPVELTDEEKIKLSNVQNAIAKYKTYLDEYQNTSDYAVEPNYESLPLIAGKYNKIALDSSTAFINIARAGLGIHDLTLDDNITEAAQHKAALVYYNSNHGLISGHNPEKPDGVSDEYFNKAQSYMNENLYHGTVLTSIINALNDGHGDPISCGHRYNLIDPYYTLYGVGAVGEGLSIYWQGAHKFSGYQNDGTELVAWPSNGIFVTDLFAYNGIGNWTAQFYNNYKVTENTDVTIKRINNGDTFEINASNKNNTEKLLVVSELSNLVTFRDDTITYENGDVFEITLHNMKDKNDQLTDYTYRSVFYYIGNAEDIPATDINIDQEEVVLKMGETTRVKSVLVPEETLIKFVEYKSNNDAIATVRQDGNITGVKPGRTTITVTNKNITKTIKVIITDESGNYPKYMLGDINHDDKVDLSDVYLALRISLKLDECDTNALETGDIDNNKKVDLSDVYRILRMSLGLE